jgi:hypothetical protein
MSVHSLFKDGLILVTVLPHPEKTHCDSTLEGDILKLKFSNSSQDLLHGYLRLPKISNFFSQYLLAF